MRWDFSQNTSFWVGLVVYLEFILVSTYGKPGITLDRKKGYFINI